MKKAFSAILLIATFVNLFVFSAFAESENTLNNEVITIVNNDGTTTYDNGDGTITTVTAIEIVDVADFNSTRSTSESKKITGSVRALNTDTKTGAVNWIYTLYAYFTYVEGESVICTDAHYTIDIADTSWHLTSGNAYMEATAGCGTGKMEHKILFFTNQTVNINLRICCDVYGNLSS